MYPNNNVLAPLRIWRPFILHALASRTNGGGPRQRPTLGDIVQRSGLTERTYLRTARKDSWGGVKLDVIERMIKGTRVNPWRMKNELRYLREHNFKIKTLNKRQQAIFDEIAGSLLQPDKK